MDFEEFTEKALYNLACVQDYIIRVVEHNDALKYTYMTRYTSVISAFLVESSHIAFDVAHDLFLVRKVRFPYQ